MKINIGIVGYGNLGKAVEREILKNKNFKLIAIFSRRLVCSKFNTLVEPYENFVNYINKIDVMMLCGGSISDLEIQTPQISEYFNTINTFDTHAKIKKQLKLLDFISQRNKTISIISCGWDPGLFSMIRCLMFAATREMPTTFWGKGISMGHSDAIRRVKGVVDGVQFTIPNKQAIKLAKIGKLSPEISKHFRECFVVSETANLNKKIEHTIKTMPNYFKHQATKVSFVSLSELHKLRKKMEHQGEIVSSYFNPSNKDCFKMNFKLKLSSNPKFTAKIMTAYITAVIILKKKKCFGAYTPLDIPVSYLFNDKEQDILFNLC